MGAKSAQFPRVFGIGHGGMGRWGRGKLPNMSRARLRVVLVFNVCPRDHFRALCTAIDEVTDGQNQVAVQKMQNFVRDFVRVDD